MRTVWWAKKMKRFQAGKWMGGKGAHYYIRMRKMRGRVGMRVRSMHASVRTRECVGGYEGHT